jgi:hypothetical protein
LAGVGKYPIKLERTIIPMPALMALNPQTDGTDSPFYRSDGWDIRHRGETRRPAQRMRDWARVSSGEIQKQRAGE